MSDTPSLPKASPFTDYVPGDEPPAPLTTVVPIGLSESDRAAAHKKNAANLLIELCRVMDQASQDGLAIRWANIAINSWGKHEVVDLHVVKRF